MVGIWPDGDEICKMHTSGRSGDTRLRGKGGGEIRRLCHQARLALASARLKTRRKWGLFCGVMIREINGRHFCGIPLWFISHLLMNKKKKKKKPNWKRNTFFLARRGSMRWQVFVYTSAPFLSLKLYCYLTVLVGVRDDKLSLIWKPFLCPYLFYGRVHWWIDHKERIDKKKQRQQQQIKLKRGSSFAANYLHFLNLWEFHSKILVFEPLFPVKTS